MFHVEHLNAKDEVGMGDWPTLGWAGTQSGAVFTPNMSAQCSAKPSPTTASSRSSAAAWVWFTRLRTSSLAAP